LAEPSRCPECGAALAHEAPGGLCAKCLLGAALSPSEPPTLAFDKSAADEAEFRRAVLSVNLLQARELERISPDAPGGALGLARALIRVGKLTPYQAGAILQNKVRGLVIGNYFVLGKLGAGGMGVVFKARHRLLGRIVAVKILSPAFGRDPGLVRRFRREVELAARLSHPNIVSVLDADEDRGVHFLTMEYIDGQDLARLVRVAGVLPVSQALDCVIQAARGLESAHAHGIVHRDVKPGNLMIDRAGVVRVLDLGLARYVEGRFHSDGVEQGSLTQSSMSMETVDFMAPEQAEDSKRVDHRADIYSLGCSLYFLLAGRAPFDGATFLQRLIAHQEHPAPRLRAARPEASRSLESAYLAMMAKRPSDRPRSMTEAIATLESCRSSPEEAAEARSGLSHFATMGFFSVDNRISSIRHSSESFN
jgi:serine/threonine protein kinase